MYPAPFDYRAPDTVEAALALLEADPDDTRLLAGGHSLLPLMKLRFVQPRTVVDLRRIAALHGIREDGDDLVIGAMTPHAAVADSAPVRARLPLLADAAAAIGDPAVRNRGTIGGSLAHADPGADLPAVMLAADARFTIAGSSGTRGVAAGDFFLGLLSTALRPAEILTEIRLPLPAPGTGSAYEKRPHPASRFAVVGVAAALTLDAGAIAGARVALSGPTPAPVRLAAVERTLAGAPATAAALDAAAARAADGLDLAADAQGPADYKAHLVRIYTRRALGRALDRARAP